jgi:hypothetical protein
MALIFFHILKVYGFVSFLKELTVDGWQSPSIYYDEYFIGRLIVGDGLIRHFH